MRLSWNGGTLDGKGEAGLAFLIDKQSSVLMWKNVDFAYK